MTPFNSPHGYAAMRPNQAALVTVNGRHRFFWGDLAGRCSGAQVAGIFYPNTKDGSNLLGKMDDLLYVP